MYLNKKGIGARPVWQLLHKVHHLKNYQKSNLKTLPPQIHGPWYQDLESVENTLKYIFEKLHHNCYILCSSGNEFEFIKLESSTTAAEAVAETQQQKPAVLQPTVEHDTPVIESSSTPVYVKPRGSFADSVAKETEVNQELLDPSVIQTNKTTGIQRI
jgi:hypothetical protein